MQSMNSQLTEQDQQRFHRQLQDQNDEIGVRSDEDEDDDESDDDETDEDDIMGRQGNRMGMSKRIF